MKKRKMLTTLAIALALVCGLAIGASAADTLKEIQAYLNQGITIQYNGEAQTMTDANGNRVYPITYNGTTYLPVRAISSMLGIEVGWDQATQTVILGGGASTAPSTPDTPGAPAETASADLMNDFKPYTPNQTGPWTILERSKGAWFEQKSSRPEEIGGETVNSWLCLWNGKSRADQYTSCLSASFNVGGKYATLTFKAYTDTDATLVVKGDNDSVLGEFSLKGGQVPQTLTVDLQNTSQLTFQRVMYEGDTGEYMRTYIFDATLS